MQFLIHVQISVLISLRKQSLLIDQVNRKQLATSKTMLWFSEMTTWKIACQLVLIKIRNMMCMRDYMMTSSNGNIFRVTGLLCGEFTGPGEFPAQRPVTRSFDVFFDLRLNKRLSKQPWGWLFETSSWSLWRQCNDLTPWREFLIYHPLLWLTATAWLVSPRAKMALAKTRGFALTHPPNGKKWPPFWRRYLQMHFRELNFCIWIKISLKFVPKGAIDNIRALV